MTTRLSEAAKKQSLQDLRGLLNNVVRFVECPITDRESLLTMWNSKFPADLYQAYKDLGKYGIELRGAASTEKCRITTDIGGKTISAVIGVNDCGPMNQARALAGMPQVAIGFMPMLKKDKTLMLKKDKTLIREVKFADDSVRISENVHETLEMSPEYIVSMLGVEKGKELLEWMKMCADMRDELILANRTLADIFRMAVTAGQIKRMVPDLLQYIPAKQRAAFEEQKRASTVPFEWAPYPKKNIDGMLLQISKGHLLSNMGKPRNEHATIELLDYHTWARYGTWV